MWKVEVILKKQNLLRNQPCMANSRFNLVIKDYVPNLTKTSTQAVYTWTYSVIYM